MVSIDTQTEISKWMDSLDETVLPPFRTCQGSWRPDFLLEHVKSTERHRICEINARFAFNGYFHSAFGQQAYIDMDKEKHFTTPAAEPKDVSFMQANSPVTSN